MMAAEQDDNKPDTLDGALTKFVNAYVRGEQLDIDEFVEQHPQYESQIRRRVASLCEIDALFDSIVQADESDFADAAPEPDLVGRTVGNFEISEMIGRGGMGVVYLGHDTKLKRSVAIKGLPAKFAADATATKRFKREAELLASLNHPNIAVIHDIIEDDADTAYLVLEYVPGETLSKRIAGKPLTVEQALSFGKQIALAISAAHKKGIAHRDLKPGNIKITPDGQVKVLDFGLAKPYTSEAKDAEATATQRHHIVGTPAYMSPEQARGQSSDHRTDIWSFGCIMYQMLTGKLPFDGKTTTDTLAHIIEREPDWELLPEDTPANIRELLRRCLEKNPDHRLDNIADVTIQISDTLSKPLATPVPAASPKLKKIAMIVAATIIVALSAVGIWFTFCRQPLKREIKLVVLPFDYFGPAGEEWLAGGITDVITNRMGPIHGLGVMSKQSGIEFKKIGIELAKDSYDFDYYLEGSVQCERPSDPNSRVRIIIRLISTADSTQAWQETYDYEKSNIIQSQIDIAEMVARALDMELFESERKAIPYGYTDNTEAYDYFLKGQHYRSLDTEEGHTKAIEMFNNAIELEENYAEPHVSLAHMLMHLYWAHGKNREFLLEGRKAAFRALELAPDLPGAHVAVGRYYYQGCDDYEKALKEFAIARNSYPNHISAIRWTAYCQKRMGRFEDALNNLLIAAKLDPVSPLAPGDIAHTLGFLRMYGEAMDYYEQVITMDPNSAWAYWQEAWLYLGWKGDIINARRAVDRVLQRNKETAENERIFHVLVTIDIYNNEYEKALERILSRSKDYGNMNWFIPNDLWLAEVYGYMDKKESARKCYEAAVATLEKKLAEDPDNYSAHSSLGKAYAGLGREDKAITEGLEGAKTKDAVNRPLRLTDLARIYVMLGRHGEAIDILEDLLFKIPSELKIYDLKLDPVWDPLRDHSRFKNLMEGSNSLKEIQPSKKDIRLVVLPFNNRDPAGQEWFVDGVGADITDCLQGIYELEVIARPSAIECKRRQWGTRQIAIKLTVDYILDGTVECKEPTDPNSALRIDLRLIDASNDTQIWSKSFEGIRSQLPDLQRQVAEHVDLTLLDQDRTLSKYIPTTQNLEAYKLWRQGMALGVENSQAIPFYENALLLDPNFARAHRALAWVQISMYHSGEDRSSERLVNAEIAANKALKLAHDIPAIQVTMARIYYQGHLNYTDALKHLNKALDLLPNHSWALYWTGCVQLRAGDFPAALENMKKAFYLDPLSAHFACELGNFLKVLRHYKEAEHYHEIAIQQDPKKPIYYAQKAWLYLVWKGKPNLARAVLDQYITKTKKPEDVRRLMVLIDICSGKYQDAFDRLSQGDDADLKPSWDIPYALRRAEIYGYLRRNELAREQYELARAALEDKVQQYPEEAYYHSSLGIAYAGLGDELNAIKHGEKGRKLLPIKKDRLSGPLREEDLARIYVMLDKHKEAIKTLEELLTIPSRLSHKLVAIDPVWDPLRDRPGFQKLLEAGE